MGWPLTALCTAEAAVGGVWFQGAVGGVALTAEPKVDALGVANEDS